MYDKNISQQEFTNPFVKNKRIVLWKLCTPFVGKQVEGFQQNSFTCPNYF